MWYLVTQGRMYELWLDSLVLMMARREDIWFVCISIGVTGRTKKAESEKTNWDNANRLYSHIPKQVNNLWIEMVHDVFRNVHDFITVYRFLTSSNVGSWEVHEIGQVLIKSTKRGRRTYTSDSGTNIKRSGTYILRSRTLFFPIFTEVKTTTELTQKKDLVNGHVIYYSDLRVRTPSSTVRKHVLLKQNWIFGEQS